MAGVAPAAMQPQRPRPEPDETSRAPGIIDDVRDMARAMCRPVGLAGVVLEASWIGLHLGLWPLGHIGARRRDERAGYRLAHLSPTQRGLAVHNIEAVETPILLVHGMADNRSIFTVLRHGLRRRGFGRIQTINYSMLTGDVRRAAADLGAEVERLVEETGYERIHVIGHSLGGLIARYYVQRLGGDERVDTLVTLGTPHQGTYVAYAWQSGLTQQLRPGSPLIAELDGPVAQCRTRFVAYRSDIDQLVVPQRNAGLHHPDLHVHNIELHGVGHMSLPITRSVVHGISSTLAHLDVSGATVTPGVSPLDPAQRRPS